jgi:hypothetical protein
MTINRRIFYACQAVGIGDKDGANFTVAHGVQSVGINTQFNLEQIFEVGMISIYENIENVPDVEVTLEKVLDGRDLLYTLSTGGSGKTLAAASVAQCSVALSIFDDTNVAATGTANAGCVMKSGVVSQITYKVAVEGNATESITIVGNHKIWTNALSPSNSEWYIDNLPATDVPDDKPDLTVQRRQHVNIAASKIPSCIPSISSFQSISVGANITREKILELGSKVPYFRYAKFPVEVTAQFEIIAKKGDQIGVVEDANNLTDEEIKLVFLNGTTIDLGKKNKLESANYQGGGTDGGNATITYSFKTFNDFTVTGPT